GVLLLSFGGLYTWFIHNSNRLLTEMVNEKSGGKLKLQLSRVNFDFFSNEVKVHTAKITSTGADKNKITYRVNFQKITLTTNSLWSAFFSNSLEIRKIKLYDPVIEVFSRRKDSADDTKNNLSLGSELGKLYHSVVDAIISLNTHSISLINAKLILNSGQKPLVFSNINFALKKLNKNRASGGKYVANNNIQFNSSNQDISLTDGIHQLMFKKLVIQNGRDIILDSCTIIAFQTLESHSSYNIHFKRLALKGVDFNAWYKNNLIKADSVYCEDPITNINLSSAASQGRSIDKTITGADKILRDFAGNLNIRFLGVMNGNIHLNISGKKSQSNIHSGKVNFQIENLRISPDSSKLISLKVFNLLVKGYQLFNKDSTCIYSFDSVRFANDKLVLNNFSVHTASGINKIRSYRNYSMPYFELIGVDWSELFFNQNLKADEAVLLDPTITYKQIAGVELTKKSFLITSHRNFDELMDIGRISIINGNVNLEWGENKSLRLQGFSANLLGDNIVDYRHVQLREDVESLFFQNGYLEVGDFNAGLKNITFKTNENIHVGQLTIGNDLTGLDAKLNDISLKNIYAEENGTIVMDGLQWNNGAITLKAIPGSKTPSKKASLLFKDVLGANTQFTWTRDSGICSAFMSNLRVSSLTKDNSSPLEIHGLVMNGRQFTFSNIVTTVHAGDFKLSDHSQEFMNAHFESNSYKGNLAMDIPSATLTSNINSLFIKGLNFRNIVLIAPVISFRRRDISAPTAHENAITPGVNIDHLTIKEPVVTLEFEKDRSKKTISLAYSKGSEIKAESINVSPQAINIEDIFLKAKKGKITGLEREWDVDNGLDLKLAKIKILKLGDSTVWSAILNHLRLQHSDGFTFNIKQDKVFLKDISIENCGVSSVSLSNIVQWLRSNQSALFRTSAAKYITKNYSSQISNASFDARLKLLKLDSFSCSPVISRDSFIASHPYQTDYIRFQSGNVRLYGFDIIKFISEKSLSIQEANLSQPAISVYRDKLPPFQAGVRKPLFTEQFKSISFPVLINQVTIHDGKVSYTERNEKNRLEGDLVLTHLNGNISNLTNYSPAPNDSLSITLAGQMQDKVAFDIKLNQSYNDRQQGFSMTLNIQPTPFNILNPLLANLSNVKFTSGGIDKFQLNAVGNDDLAKGTIKFYYHDLHIQLLKDGGVQKTAFIKRRESDLVNFLFLKNDNNSRTGAIYFKRLKDFSFFNYINKIIFSGISSSVNTRRNKKYVKLSGKKSPSTLE
ncbi:MAG: hypothetical protein ABIR19_00870, partial [Ginsengibacter sp.]